MVFGLKLKGGSNGICLHVHVHLLAHAFQLHFDMSSSRLTCVGIRFMIHFNSPVFYWRPFSPKLEPKKGTKGRPSKDHLFLAMTSLVDSRAHFVSRLTELGLGAGLITNIENHGVVTLSQLAFAVGQPGQPLTDIAIDQFVQAASGRAAVINEISILKRAAFEAQTFLIATLRQSVDRTDEAPRKIAFAERTSRMQALRAALAGIEVSGEQEPAHCVLDKACAIYESNTLKYLDPASCVSRAHEIQGTTKNRELTFEKGSLVLKSGEDKLSSPTDSEIKVHYAMVRRGLAFQFARLMSHSQHCQWETFLFEAMHRDAPPGYSRPSLAQLLQCDKAAWSRLASIAVELRQRADGTYPLGEALLNLRNDPNIALYLAPLMKQANPGGQGGGGHGNPNQDRYNPYQHPGNPKGKGKGKKKNPPVPAELRGKWYKTSKGEPLCFGFNCASGCPNKVAPGEKCPRGWHLCAEPKCQKAHSLQQHQA